MGVIRSSMFAVAVLCAGAHSEAIAQDGTSPGRETPPADSRTEQPSRQRPVERARPAGQQPKAKRAGASKRQLQLKGKVSEVWQAPVEADGSADTVVLVETEQGQTIAANLGPAQRLEGVALDEGAPVMVAGALVRMGSERYFVPGKVQIGEQPMDLEREPVRLTALKRRQVSGKIVEARQMGAEGGGAPDTQMAVIEVSPRERVVVDLGPADQVADLPLSEGQTVDVAGFETRLEERELLVAQQVRAGDAQARIQRQGKSPPAR